MIVEPSFNPSYDFNQNNPPILGITPMVSFPIFIFLPIPSALSILFAYFIWLRFKIQCF